MKRKRKASKRGKKLVLSRHPNAYLYRDASGYTVYTGCKDNHILGWGNTHQKAWSHAAAEE